jgi:glycosyltransferase involved in cell wall biosynthesis
MPKISVIMPLYNAEQFVKKSIESILTQSYEDFELLLIDDCSTDNTLEVASSIKNSKIKIVNNERNMGIAFSRNKGLDLAEGQYIALMDDDDLTVPNRFEIQVNYLGMHNEIDIVGGRHCVIDERDQVIWTCRDPLNNPKYIRADMMLYNPIANGSAMIRNDFLRENRIKYQDGCLGMEDYRFWIDCSVWGNITNLNDILLYWRNSGANETSRMQTIKSKQRAEKYAYLQRYAFELNGYFLSEEDYGIINEMFPEKFSSTVVSIEDIKKLHSVFGKVIQQAKQFGAENANEVEIMCKKRFSRRLEFSELWL